MAEQTESEAAVRGREFRDRLVEELKRRGLGEVRRSVKGLGSGLWVGSVDVVVMEQTSGYSYKPNGRLYVRIDAPSDGKTFPEPKKGFDLKKIVDATVEMYKVEQSRREESKRRAKRSGAAKADADHLRQRFGVGGYTGCVRVGGGADGLDVSFLHLNAEEAASILEAVKTARPELFS